MKNNGKHSKLQSIIEQILNKNNIMYRSEVGGKFKKFNQYLNKIYSPVVDILIDDIFLVIEIYGNIWHANPILYKKDDVIIKFKGSETAKNIWKFDNERENQIRSFGYDVLILWEYDIKSNKQIIEEKILYEISRCKNRKN